MNWRCVKSLFLIWRKHYVGDFITGSDEFQYQAKVKMQIATSTFACAEETFIVEMCLWCRKKWYVIILSETQNASDFIYQSPVMSKKM